MKWLCVVFLLLSIAVVFPTHECLADEATKAQQRLEAAKYRETQSRTLYDNFSRKTGMKQLVDPGTLSTNPFAYKGTTVGVALWFEKMISANEAHFRGYGSDFLISRTPSTKFTTRSAAFLAVKVLGTKDGKTHLQYVDSFSCRDGSCDDILYWTRASREKAEASRDLVRAKQHMERVSKYKEQEKAQNIARNYFKMLGENTLTEVLRVQKEKGDLSKIKVHAHLVCIFQNGQLSSVEVSKRYEHSTKNVDLVLSALKNLLPRPFPIGMYDKYQVTIMVEFYNVVGNAYHRSAGSYDEKPLSDKLASVPEATQDNLRRIQKGQQAYLWQLKELLEEQKRLAQQGDTEAKMKVKHLEERIKKIEGH